MQEGIQLNAPLQTNRADTDLDHVDLVSSWKKSQTKSLKQTKSPSKCVYMHIYV